MRRLQRLLGPATAFLIGLGVAVGSGIFRTPGQIAAELGSPLLVVLAWVFGGLFILASSLVSAELATRFPEAGGEYVYLREAYGGFFAFLFGWGYSVFIIGGGAAIIAVALGEAVAQLLGVDVGYANRFGVAAIVVITSINAGGLRAGAGLQNALTGAKVVALIGVAAVALVLGDAGTDWSAPMKLAPGRTSGLAAFLAALPPVLWTYEGSTDAVKMAEEIKDVRRDLPRALVGSAVALTALYVLFNVACMTVLTPAEMGGVRFVPNEVMLRLFGPIGLRVMQMLAIVVLAGALSSTVLTTVRVTFALARDGLAPRSLARMSEHQAPVTALLAVGAIAIIFTAFRSFAQILGIYFLAAALLFGLAYASLIVFRARDRREGRTFPSSAFRCPAGPLLAGLLIAVQIAMAGLIFWESFARRKAGQIPDSVYTLLLLASFGAVYLVLRRFQRS